MYVFAYLLWRLPFFLEYFLLRLVRVFDLRGFLCKEPPPPPAKSALIGCLNSFLTRATKAFLYCVKNPTRGASPRGASQSSGGFCVELPGARELSDLTNSSIRSGDG